MGQALDTVQTAFKKFEVNVEIGESEIGESDAKTVVVKKAYSGDLHALRQQLKKYGIPDKAILQNEIMIVIHQDILKLAGTINVFNNIGKKFGQIMPADASRKIKKASLQQVKKASDSVKSERQILATSRDQVKKDQVKQSERKSVKQLLNDHKHQ